MRIYSFHIIEFLFDCFNSFLYRTSVGVEDRFPQRPHFLYLLPLFQLCVMLFTHHFGILQHFRVQNLS